MVVFVVVTENGYFFPAVLSLVYGERQTSNGLKNYMGRFKRE